jgi:hypothetical protein
MRRKFLGIHPNAQKSVGRPKDRIFEFGIRLNLSFVKIRLANIRWTLMLKLQTP